MFERMIPSSGYGVHHRIIKHDWTGWRRHGLESFGGYNEIPTPYHSIGEFEFAENLVRRRIVGVEFRQPSELRYANTQVFWLEEHNGVAVSLHFVKTGWESRYWFLGCNHHMVETHSTEFTHFMECSECEYETSVDSSG